jgi:ribonuclease-3
MAGPDLHALQAKLGHHFNDLSLLERALTHRSCGVDSNERLEFLGDAILNYVVGEMLFIRYPRLNEGDMSRIRSGMVCHRALLRVAGRIGLQANVKVAQWQHKKIDTVLSDALEACFAAVQCDAGHDKAKAVILHHMIGLLERDEVLLTKDGKTKLQEFLQARCLPLPVYQLTAQNRHDEASRIEIECVVEGLAVVTRASGPTRKEAEKAAATMALALCHK